jgi:hypothetical protein
MEINNKIWSNLPLEIINHILSYRPQHPTLSNTCHDYSTDFEHDSFNENINNFNKHYKFYNKIPFYVYMLELNDVDKYHKTRRIIMIEHFKKANIVNYKIDSINSNYSCNCGFMANEDERYHNFRRIEFNYSY